MSTAFDNEQFTRNYPSGIERNFWHTCRNRILFDVVASISSKKVVLEVGCGTGIVVRFLRSRGIDAHGVELGMPIIENDLVDYITTGVSAENLPVEFRNSVEVLMLCDVLEHVEDPSVFLKRLMEFFPRVSHVVFTVPAGSYLWSSFDVINGHFLRYNRSLCFELVKDVNMCVTFCSYFFHSLVFPLWFFRKRNSSKHIAHPPKSSLFHKFIGLLFYVEYYVLPSWLFGSSLVCVAKKRE